MDPQQETELQHESRIVKIFSRIVLPQGQILNMIIVSVAAMWIAYYPYSHFLGKEKEAPVLPVTPAHIKEWGGVPTRVTAGLFISNFPKLDFVNNEFQFEGILWFEFDPALISLTTVGKFEFEKGKILYQSEPYTQVINNKFFARYNIRVQFSVALDFKLFPFDNHTLAIVLVNKSIAPSEMIFRSYVSFFTVSPEVSIAGWSVHDIAVKTGLTQDVLDKHELQKTVSHPRAVFLVSLRRFGVRNILLILLPLFMIYFMSLFSFAFDPKTHSNTIFGLSSAAVTVLLGYRFVIETMTPKVGYFVTSDKLFILFLAAALVEFIFAVIIVRFGRLTPLIIILRGILFLLINIIFLSTWYYFLRQF